MNLHFLFVVLLLLSSLNCVYGKSKNVALPRKKSSTSNRQGFFSRIMREVKTSFCSDLEALTLQLTKPTDAAIPLQHLDSLISCLDEEYENPAFTVSLLAKFSRKFSEPNINTKLKALISIHKLMNNTKEKAQQALMQSMRALRSETDLKNGMSFFSADSIEEISNSAVSVGEMEAIELAREYAIFVFDYIDCRGEKFRSKSGGGEDRAELLLGLLDQIDVVEKTCRKSRSQIVRQCLSIVEEDKKWVVNQLRKIYDSGLNESEIESKVVASLQFHDSSFNPKPIAKIVKAEKDEEEEVEEDIKISTKKESKESISSDEEPEKKKSIKKRKNKPKTDL